MRTTLVYDLPTRLFHWLFSALFLISFTIGKTVDDESLVFSYHMISGLIMTVIVTWRILWGIFGSRQAQFTGFSLHPVELKNYFKGIISGSKKRWLGHNPASSWASLAMFTLALGLGTTGYLMSTGDKEAFEDIHEIMANTFILIVLLHVAGLVLHSLRHKDAIGLSMIDGKKEIDENIPSLSSSRPWSALVLVILVFSASLFILKNFDSATRNLTVFGKTMSLGESGEKVTEEDK